MSRCMSTMYFAIVLLMLILAAVGHTVATAVDIVIVVVVAVMPSLDIVTVCWSYGYDY